MQEDLNELNHLLSMLQEEGEITDQHLHHLQQAAEKSVVLKKHFLVSFIQQQGSRAAAWTVLVSQRLITQWLNDLFALRKNKRRRNRYLEELETNLASFLDFLHYRFPDYFNQHEQIPHSIWVQKQDQLEGLWEHFQHRYGDAVDPTLMALVHNTYALTLRNQQTPTYHEYAYWMRLWEVLPTDLPGIQTDLNEAMVQTFIRYNFNSKDVVAFLMQRLVQMLEQAPNAMHFWMDHFRYVIRIPDKTLLGFVHDLPSCKKQMVQSIKKELMVCQHEANVAPQQNSLAAAIQFQTNLSVSQLAAFFRLMVEAGVLVTSNNRELMRMVGITFQTNRTKSAISEQHLYDKFYSLEGPALSIVRTYLMTMLQKIQQFGYGGK